MRGQSRRRVNQSVIKQRRLNILLYDATNESLKRLEEQFGSASAAINDAILFRAHFAKRELTEVKQALALVDTLRRLQQSDGRIVFQSNDPEKPPEVLILTLG